MGMLRIMKEGTFERLFPSSFLYNVFVHKNTQMKFKKLHATRLLKLACHLLHGKLGHKRFNFNAFNSDDGHRPAEYKCGTNGCAIGECPIIFKRQWMFDKYADPVIRAKGFDDSLSSAEKFFQLTNKESGRLFTPTSGFPSLVIGGVEFEYLPRDATKTQVARNIIKFVKAKCRAENIDILQELYNWNCLTKSEITKYKSRL